MKKVDARNKPCPQPVLLLKDLVEKGEKDIRIIVDNEGAVSNIKRYGEGQGYSVTSGEEGKDYLVTLIKTEPEGESFKKTPNEKRVLFISSDSLGKGSEELGKILIKAFSGVLDETGLLPSKIIFVNSGVRLAAEGSDILEALLSLEKKGVEILSCGTCLDYFGIKDRLKVGNVSNAYEILESLFDADNVIPFG